MEKIGLFYAPALGSTEKVAKLVEQKIGSEKIEKILIQKDTPAEEMKKYKKLILGISTVGRDRWDSSYSAIGWDFMIPKISEIDLSNQTVAMFGLGNQVLYPDNFVDGMGFLKDALDAANANLIGHWSIEDYDFTGSEALKDDEDKFPGVAIDEDNEPEKTEERIDKWLTVMKDKLSF